MERKRVKKSKSGKDKRKKEEEPKPFVTSRASPPARDDFEDEAVEEASVYAAQAQNELDRRRIREENRKRVREGLSRLPLPKKLKIVSGKRSGSGSEAEEVTTVPELQEDTRELKYEGQVELGFDPLPILATHQPDEEIVVDPKQNMSPKDYALARIQRQREKLEQREAELQAKRERLLQQRLSNGHIDSDLDEVTPDVHVKEEIDAKPDITVKTEPTTPVKVEPGVKVGLGVVKIERHSSPIDVKPDISSDLKPEVIDDEEADDEEEDYGEEEDAWRKVKPTAEQSAVGQTIEDPVEVDDEEEEYSDSELFIPSLNTSSLATELNSQSQSVVTVGSKILAVKERPPFPCTPKQRLIGPYCLDDNDPTMVIPASINRFLREYQRAGTKFLYTKYKRGVGGILGDDMGLGKTVQVISFLSAIMRKTGTSEDRRRRKTLIRNTGQLLPPQQWPTALIICPTSLIGNWSREFDTWGYFEYQVWSTESYKATELLMKGGYLDIVLVSNELAVKFADILKGLKWSVVIVDEAHRLKKPKSLLTLAVKKLNCRSCFALTGTLIQNKMDEMWSVLDFVWRGWAGTIKEWRTYVVKPISKGHRHDGTIGEVTAAVKRIGEISHMVLPHFYLRRDKRLIADELPLKRDFVVLCPLGRRQSKVYQKITESEDVEFILKATEPCPCGRMTVNQKRPMTRTECHFEFNSVGDTYKVAVLKMFDALGRVSNHLALLYQSRDDPPRVRETNKRIFQFCTGEPYDPGLHNIVEASIDPDNCGKWALLESLLKEWRARPEENNKGSSPALYELTAVLIFSNSVRLLKLIETFMETSEELSGFDCELFSGEVDKDDRMEMVDRFQDMSSKNFVMLVSTMAGGVGLNLTAANKVVIFDPNWNPANDLQAMDRAFRIGQKRPVDVYRLIGQGTIEELMYERQIYKQQRARQMNDGTFERRTHRGYVDAKHMEDKGELFGVHNMFKYKPEGFVKDNLERVRLAEDRVRQDLIKAEYDEEDEEDDDDEESRTIRQARKEKALRKATISTDDDGLLNEIMSDGVAPAATGDSGVFEKLGITPMLHEAAFRDSPEERRLYEIGLQITERAPHMLDMLANEAGKVRLEPRGPKRQRASDGHTVEVNERPWADRLKAGKKRNAGKALVVDDD